MLPTMAALVVGKAVLVAIKVPLLRRYDRVALIQLILFKRHKDRVALARWNAPITTAIAAGRHKTALSIRARSGLR